MLRSIPLAALLIGAACSSSGRVGGIRIGKGPVLSYAQARSLETGMRAAAIRNAFGKPVHALEEGGRTRGLTYWSEDSTGAVRELRMVFDEEERLKEWVLRDPAQKG